MRFVESKTRTLVRPHSRLEALRGQGAEIPHRTSAARAVGAARVRNLSAGAGLKVCVVRPVSQDVSQCMHGMLVPHATAGQAASLTCRWERRALLDEQKHSTTAQHYRLICITALCIYMVWAAMAAPGNLRCWFHRRLAGKNLRRT